MSRYLFQLIQTALGRSSEPTVREGPLWADLEKPESLLQEKFQVPVKLSDVEGKMHRVSMILGSEGQGTIALLRMLGYRNWKDGKEVWYLDMARPGPWPLDTILDIMRSRNTPRHVFIIDNCHINLIDAHSILALAEETKNPTYIFAATFKHSERELEDLIKSLRAEQIIRVGISVEVPPLSPDLFLKRYHLRLLTPDFIDGVSSATASAKDFYEFTEPSWPDIASNFDVIRRDTQLILTELDKAGSKFIFLPLLAPSGEGKSTFLRRLAYELYSRNEIVLFLEIDPSVWNVDIEQLVVDLRELFEARRKSVHLLIDNCFRFDIESLILSIANQPFPIRIIGTSQVREYDKSVERYRHTILDNGKPFYLRPLNEQEISSLIDKLINYKVIELSNGMTRESLFEICKTKTQFVDLMSKLLPSNRFGTRVEWFVKRIETNRTVYTLYKYICLVYQCGLGMPLSLLLKVLQRKCNQSFNEEDIAREITRSAEAEIVVSKVRDTYFLHLRHERWAVEGIKTLFPKGIGLVQSLEDIVCLFDEASPVERRFIANLLTRLRQIGQTEVAQTIYFSKSFLGKSKAVEAVIPVKEYLDYWLNLQFAFRHATREDLDTIEKLLSESLKSNPADQELYFKNEYFKFLRNKFQNDHESIVSKFTDVSMVNRPMRKKDHEALYEEVLQRLSFLPRSSVLVSTLVDVLSFMGKYQEIRHIFESFEFPPEERFLFKKADFYFENEEFEKAWNIYKSCSTRHLKFRYLRRSYQRFLLHYDYDLALQEIEREARENPRKAFFLRIELYIIHSRREELEVLWKNYKPRPRPYLTYLWYIVSLAFLGRYYEAKRHLNKLLTDSTFITTRYMGSQATYLSTAFYYLGKSFGQNPRNWADSYRWLQLARELAIQRQFYTIRIDKEIDRLNNSLLPLFAQSPDKSRLVMPMLIVAKRYRSLIPDRIRDKLLRMLRSYCEREIAEGSNNYDIHFKYAQVLAAIGEKIEAQRQFEKALELNPTDAELNNQYANFLKDELQNYLEAEVYYRRAIEYDKRNNPKYLNNLALLFIDTMDADKFEEAENLLSKAVEISDFGYAKINLERLKTIRARGRAS